jgi:hypothetical protein
MTGHEHRAGARAELLPGRRERLLGGASMQLVTLRLFDGPGVVDDHGRPSGRPGAFTDLRPGEARLLADQLLDCAQHAEALPRETD